MSSISASSISDDLILRVLRQMGVVVPQPQPPQLQQPEISSRVLEDQDDDKDDDDEDEDKQNTQESEQTSESQELQVQPTPSASLQALLEPFDADTMINMRPHPHRRVFHDSDSEYEDNSDSDDENVILERSRKLSKKMNFAYKPFQDMQKHPKSIEKQCLGLKYMTINPDYAVHNQGEITILDVMERFQKNVDIQYHSCAALYALTFADQSKKQWKYNPNIPKSMPLIVQAIQNHPYDSHVLINACNVIKVYSLLQRDLTIDLGGIEAIIKILQQGDTIHGIPGRNVQTAGFQGLQCITDKLDRCKTIWEDPTRDYFFEYQNMKAEWFKRMTDAYGLGIILKHVKHPELCHLNQPITILYRLVSSFRESMFDDSEVLESVLKGIQKTRQEYVLRYSRYIIQQLGTWFYRRLLDEPKYQEDFNQAYLSIRKYQEEIQEIIQSKTDLFILQKSHFEKIQKTLTDLLESLRPFVKIIE